jgi:dipeptidase D
MSHLLTNIEPVEVWDHFSKLAQIPRPSGGELAVCSHIYSLAGNLGLELSMDTAGCEDFGNIIVRCPATPGHEKAPITVIQSHVDMVAFPDERKDLPFELLLAALFFGF